MIAYVDSGVLVKLYVREPSSSAAAATISGLSSVGISPLHELEIRNTLRVLEGRRVITEAERAASEHTLESDIVSRRLLRMSPDWTEVYRLAGELSAVHSAETLARSLDIIHVAIAIARGTDLFVTADRRQEAVARRAGLATELIA